MYKTIDEAYTEVQKGIPIDTLYPKMQPFKDSESFMSLAGYCMLVNPLIMSCVGELLAIAAASFEAGRLYGRSQVLDEIEKENYLNVPVRKSE